MDITGYNKINEGSDPFNTGEYYYLIECSDTNYDAYQELIKDKYFEFRYLGSFDVS